MRQIENQLLVIFTNVVTVGEQLIEIAENKKKVALTNYEAESQRKCATVQEALSLRQLKQDLFITQVKATPIAEDKESCFELCSNPVFQKKIQTYINKISLYSRKC